MHRIFLIVAGAVLTAPAVAQTPPSDPLTGKAALGYIATSGNTESTSANASFSIDYARVNWSHGVDLSAIAASTDDETTAEAYQFQYEARRAFGDVRFNYLFTTLAWKRDRFSGFPEQLSETIGYGRRLIASDRHVFDAGLGLGARQAQRLDGVRERDAIVRGTADYLWTLTDTTQFEQALVVESGSNNTMLETRSALRARIVGSVALVLSYRFKRNSAASAGAVSSDRFSSIALEYAF